MSPIRFFKSAALVLALALPAACTPGGLFDVSHGKMAVDVKWPRSGAYRVLAIPPGTARIDLAIVGEGIPDGQPIKASLTPQPGDASTVIDQVPIGPKFLTATAYDAQSHALAAGQTTIAVQPNVIVAAEITLSDGTTIPIADKAHPGADPSASATLPAPPVASAVPDFTIGTVAGTGQQGAQDGREGALGSFRYPRGAAFNPLDHALYIADAGNHLIRRFDPVTHALSTLSGTVPPSPGPSGGPGPAPLLAGASFGTPGGLTVDAKGTIYFTDLDLRVVRKVLADGSTVTVAGTGHPGDADGPDALACPFNLPIAIASDAAGNLYVADWGNQKIKRIDPHGAVTTLAGTGEPGSTGDGGAATAARIDYPAAIAVDAAGRYLYLAETQHPRVRRIDLTTGVITTVAGTGQFGFENEEGAATKANLTLPVALGFAGNGDLLIAEGWGLTVGASYTVGQVNRVLRLDGSGVLTRIAGRDDASPNFGGDGGDARQAILNNPAGLATDADGTIYLIDSYNNRVRALVPAPAPTPPPAPRPSAAPSTK